MSSMETESIKSRAQELERELAALKVKYETESKEKDFENLRSIEKIKTEFESKIH